MRQIATFILLLLLSLFSMVVQATLPLDKVSLQLSWKHQFESAGFYAAIEQGYFAEQGLEVEIREYQEGMNIVEEVTSGRADFGIYSGNLLFERMVGKPVVWLANYFKRFPLVLLARPGLNSLADLKGKKLMIPQKDRDSIVVRAAFHQAGLIAGKNIELLPHSFDVGPFIRGEVDAMTAFYSNEPYFLERQNFPYQIIELTESLTDLGAVDLFTSNAQAEAHPERIRAIIRAANQGWHYALEHPQEIVDLILQKYSSRKGRDALLYEAEKTQELMMPQRYAIGSLFEGRIRSALQMLLVIDGRVSENQLEGLLFDQSLQKQLVDSRFWKKSSITLTESEQAYLDGINFRRIHVSGWMPFNFKDSDGKVIGIAEDYWGLIRDKLGLKEIVSKPSTFAKMLADMQQGKTDLYPSTTSTRDREAYAYFSKSYAHYPIALATRKGSGFISSASVLEGKVVAVGRNYSAYHMLKARYPGIEFLQVTNTQEALERVAEGEAYAAADILPVLQYQIEYFSNNIKLAGVTDIKFPLQVMVSKQHARLVPLIDRAIAAITPEERMSINKKWMLHEVISAPDYTLLWQVLGTGLLILLLMFYWNRKLRREIIGRKQAEHSLHESEGRLRSIIDTEPECIKIIDQNGLLLQMNPAGLAMIEADRLEQVVGRPVLELIVPEYRDAYAHLHQQVIAGEAVEMEYEVIGLKGGRRWLETHAVRLEDRGEPTHLALTRDISERKRAEEALRKLSRAVEQSHSTIIITDIDANIEFVNPSFTRTTGYSQQEAIGQNPRILHSGDQDLSIFQAMWKALKQGKQWQGELHNKRKDGTLYWEFATISPVNDEAGKTSHYVAVKEDITARKRAEQQLIEAQQQAETANQAKSEFLSSMSHEIRTPMNAILGFAQLLKYDDNLKKEQQDNIDEILKGGNHLLKLINKVLDLSKIESGHIELSLESVELKPLVDECFTLIMPMTEKLEINISHTNEDIYFIRADKVRLKQIILNLLSNAIKYNCKQGNVDLGVTQINDTEIRITVTDTGNGIVKEKLGELFQPFNRLDAENSGIEGTGIGLSITRKLAELMGGRIGVSSELDTGSQFWVELPMARASLQGESNEAEETIIESSIKENEPQRTVLYIEDNPANLKLVSRILAKQLHINLITAHEPNIGLELASAHRPELILLDINMPVMDGYQILDTLKLDEQLKGIPVIAVTANAMSKDIERGKAAGFSDYLTKPLNIEKFISILNHYLK